MEIWPGQPYFFFVAQDEKTTAQSRAARRYRKVCFFMLKMFF
jgi:hypothetical protein